MFIIIETLHDQSFSLTSEDTEPQRFQTTSYWVPKDQGTGVIMSQCMKLVFVSFTQLHNIIVISQCLRGVHVLREALVIEVTVDRHLKLLQ